MGLRLLWAPTALDTIETAFGFNDSQIYYGEQRARYSWQQLGWQRLTNDDGDWRAFIYHNRNHVSASGLLAIGEISGLLPSPDWDLWLGERDRDVGLDVRLRRVDLGEDTHFVKIDESGWSERWDGELRRHWRSPSWELSVGGATSFDRAKSLYLTDQKSTLDRQSGRIYATGSWRLNPRWQFSGGMMGEWAQGLSPISALRSGLNYHIAPGQSLRLAIALGARQPTLLEQNRQSVARDKESGTVDLITQVDADLDIERSQLVELGYHWRSANNRIEFDGRWYHQELFDLIKPAEIQAFVVRPIAMTTELHEETFLYYDNRGDISQHGLELQLSARHRQHWLLHATLGYLQTRVADDPLQLETELNLEEYVDQVPFDIGLGGERWTAGATASYTFANEWSLATHLHWQNRTAGWMSEDFSGSTRWDISALRSWRWREGGSTVDLSVALRNLTDERLLGIVDYPSRRIVVKLELKLP